MTCFARPYSACARPIGVEIIYHKGMGRSSACTVILAQMRMIGRKIIMAMRDQFGIV